MKTLTFVLLAVLVLNFCDTHASVRKIEFQNNTGQKVDDLHIVLENSKVRDTLTSTFPSKRHDNGSDTYNFYGVIINTASTATVTFVVDSGDIKIKEWWWTKGGNALKDGDQVPNQGKKVIKDDGGAMLSWNGGASSGEGLLRLSKMGIEREFITIPGRMPHETAQDLINFINLNFNDGENSLVQADLCNPGMLYVSGNILGDTAQSLKITILSQDPSQPLTILPYTPNTLNLTVLFEGFYDNLMNDMNGDYAKIELRSFTAPYALIYLSGMWIDSTGKGMSYSYNTVNNTPYYIVVKHRNSIETWSQGPSARFLSGVMNYNFTTSPFRAFGGNQKLKGTRWCIYSGDVNQDGVIDGSDMNAIDNDAANFMLGFLPTDVTGDEITDASDLSVTDNNANNFVITIRP